MDEGVGSDNKYPVFNRTFRGTPRPGYMASKTPHELQSTIYWQTLSSSYNWIPQLKLTSLTIRKLSQCIIAKLNLTSQKFYALLRTYIHTLVGREFRHLQLVFVDRKLISKILVYVTAVHTLEINYEQP